MATTRRSKKPKSVLDYNYKVDTEQSIAKRLAAFMHWAAQEMPLRAIPYQIVAKIVLVIPSARDKDVDRLKSAIGEARKTLALEYKRGLLAIPGMGLRATTSNEDVAETQLEKDAKRVVSAAVSLDRTRSIINVSKIVDADLRNRVNRISQATKVLTSGDVLEKLRLPAAKKDDDDKDK